MASQIYSWRVNCAESHEPNIKNIKQKVIQHNEHPLSIRVFIKIIADSLRFRKIFDQKFSKCYLKLRISLF